MHKIWALIPILALQLWAGPADDILRKSGEKIHHAKYWSLHFTMEASLAGKSNSYTGDLLLGPNDRFHLTIPGQEYVSDGATLWQYNRAQKQVMVKNVADLQGAMHPSEALFRYLKCKPISLKQGTDGKETLHIIKLDPQGQVKGFTSMEVWLKASDLTPLRLITVDRTGTTALYRISELRENPPLQEKDFQFKATPDVEEIDMR